MDLSHLPEDTIRRIIREVKPKKAVAKRKTSTHVPFQIEGMHQYPIVTTSTRDILKFIFGEIVHDIHRRSPANIKGMIAEAGEWMAQIEPNPMTQGKIRKMMSNLMLMKSRDKLMQAVASFTSSLVER